MSQFRQSIDSLATPGVAVVAPIAPRQDLGRQLLQALGVTADIAGTAGAIAERERREIDRELDNALDELQGKGFELGVAQPGFTSPDAIKAYNEGLASRHALEFLSTLEDKIESGEISPAEGESVPDAIRRVVHEQTREFDSAYRVQYAKVVIPQALQVLAGKQRQLRKQSVDEGLELLASKAAAAAGDPAQLNSIDQEATALAALDRRSRQEVLARVFAPAAEAAAVDGDDARLAAYLERFGADLPDTAARLRRTALMRQREREEEEERIQIDLINSMRTPEERRAAIEASDLDATTKRGMLEREERELLEAALNDIARLPGREALEEIDRLEPTIGAVRARALREDTIRRSQGTHAERVMIDVHRQRMLPADGLMELQERLDLYRRDPSHPDAIDFGQYDAAARSIMSTQEKIGRLDVAKATLREIMGQPNGIGVPLTSDFDDAIKATWAEDGIAEIVPVPDKPDQFLFLGVTQPELAAARTRKTVRVLPEWADQIAEGLNAGTAQPQLAMAIRSYAALHFQDPRLAAGVRSRLTDAGKVRADFAVKQLEQRHAEMLLPGTAQVNPAWIERVNAIAGQVLQVEPVEITNDQARLRLFGTDNPLDAAPAIRESIESLLPEGMDDTWFRELYTLGYSGRDVAIGDRAVNAYHDYALEEYRAQVSRGLSEEHAAAAAQKMARDRVLAEFAPVLWNGVTHVGQRTPYAFTPELGEQLRRDLAEQIKAGKLSYELDHYEQAYMPAWDPDVRLEDGRLGGWVLRSNTGDPDDPGLLIGGARYVFLPDEIESKTIQQLREEWEAKNRALRQLRDPEVGMRYTKGDPLGERATSAHMPDPLQDAWVSMAPPEHRDAIRRRLQEEK